MSIIHFQAYRENCSANWIHKQGLNVVWGHFFAKYWQGVMIQGIPAVSVQPPEDACPPCETSAENKGSQQNKTTLGASV